MRKFRLVLCVMFLILQTSFSQPLAAGDGNAISVGAATNTLVPEDTRPAKPSNYCKNTTGVIQGPSSPPTPFFYQPFSTNQFVWQVWTSQMDHATPNYKRDGVVATLGEKLRYDNHHPAFLNDPSTPLTGGTNAWTKHGTAPTFFDYTINPISKESLGYQLFYYQSPFFAESGFDSYLGYDGHDGNDFAVTGDALSVAAGIVAWAGNNGDSYGNVIEVYHPEGYLTRYAHLAVISVTKGQTISAGQKVGVIGGSGGWRVHLHFSTYRWSSILQAWQITDPFGWDPWAGTVYQEHDPLVSCNGEVSYNLWFGGWPQTRNSNRAPKDLQRPSNDQYLGGLWEDNTVPLETQFNNATLLADVTLPDGISVSPSQSLVKIWRFKNAGTSTWGTGYQLVFVSGEQMGAPNSVNVPSTAPNASADISINLTAPTVAGDHSGYWQLRNPQGTYFGPKVWVKIKVVTTNPGNNHIAVFDASPASPSAATLVHVVGRINTFPEFRSMRFVLGNETREMTNFRQVGSQYEISVDWNTATLARGNYTLAFEVATQGDTSWSNPERQIKTYTLTGTPASTNRPPDRPVLLSPYNWYLKDAAGASAPVQMCISPVNDPDGDAVQYYFDVTGASPTNSGWISSACWTATLAPNGYAWHVKARDSKGAESGWSAETWNFNVAYGNVAIDAPSFYLVSDPDNTHMCVLVTYGGIIAPEVKAWINLANDGSDNGEWKQLDHYGPSAPPDCTTSNVHGFWIRSANYQTGNHAIRITAVKNDSGASANRTVTHNIPYMRPSAPRAIAPSNYENNGTWWNTPTINFQWVASLRADGYRLRASTSTDVWNDPSPVLDVSLGANVTSYTRTFNQDYAKLTWSVRASNSAGSADSGGGLWFGIDRVAPSCTVTAPSVSYDNIFQVNWSGADNAAGIRTYEISALDVEGGTSSVWRTVPAVQTYDLFNGQPGHHYTFNCRATDNAGNVSGWLSNATTKVDPNARPVAPWWNASYAAKRQVIVLNNMPGVTLANGYPVKLRFDGTTSPSATEIYNASLSNPKCNDVRIVYNDATQLNRIVTKCSTSEIEMWFRTQSTVGGAGNSNVYQLYYGNAGAGSPPADRNGVLYPALDANHLRIFDMHEGSGTTLYDTTGNNSASLGSELSWSPNGKFGASVLIPGDQTPEPRYAIYAGYGPQPSCAFSVELWLKRLAGHNYGGTLAEQEGGYSNPWRWMLKHNGSRLEMSIAGRGTVYSDASLNEQTFFDNWHHVAVTYNCNGEVRFYIDGTLDTVATVSSGLDPATVDLRIGNNAYNNQRLAAYINGFALSNVVRTSFPYGTYAAITNEPIAQAGTPQTPPVTGTRTLEVLGVNTYPNPVGGLIVEGLVRNNGTLSTGNGFSTDLYINHVPTGQGDFTGSVSFWVNDPISAGATVTLTTVITDVTQLRALWAGSAQRLASASTKTPAKAPAFPLVVKANGEVNGTFYAQADSTSSVMNGATVKSIYSTGTPFCLANSDAYEPGDLAPASAPVISLNEIQRRNFYQQGDQDWVKFTTQAGINYTIQTSNLGSNADTYLYLYGTDGTTLIASNDDYGGTLASRIDWTAPTSGTYYMMSKHWNPNVGGCGTSYDLMMNRSVSAGENPIYLPFIKK